MFVKYLMHDNYKWPKVGKTLPYFFMQQTKTKKQKTKKNSSGNYQCLIDYSQRVPWKQEQLNFPLLLIRTIHEESERLSHDRINVHNYIKTDGMFIYMHCQRFNIW